MVSLENGTAVSKGFEAREKLLKKNELAAGHERGKINNTDQAQMCPQIHTSYKLPGIKSVRSRAARKKILVRVFAPHVPCPSSPMTSLLLFFYSILCPHSVWFPPVVPFNSLLSYLHVLYIIQKHDMNAKKKKTSYDYCCRFLVGCLRSCFFAKQGVWFSSRRMGSAETKDPCRRMKGRVSCGAY